MTSATIKELDKFIPDCRLSWRKWLDKNHTTKKGVWLVYYKKNTGKPTVSYDAAVEEALCYGWIDSLINRLDDEKYMQLFTPRKKNSIWSKVNKERIEKLLKENKIQSAGLEKIKQAKADGSWTKFDHIEAMIIPEDFKKALNVHPSAEENFNKCSKSYKKGILYWIDSSKRQVTRKNRIAKAVEAAAKNEKINL